jgi:hypothetical protein
MFAKLDYLSVRETRPGGNLELVWHELGDPVGVETIGTLQELLNEEGATEVEAALERVLRGAESIAGPVWLQFDEKSPFLPALDWERFVYNAVAKAVFRIRRWTLPSFRRSPLGSVLTLLADFEFEEEIGGILNELVEATHSQGDKCVVASSTEQAGWRAAQRWGERPFPYFFAGRAFNSDLKSSLSELQGSFETLFVVADPWWSDGEPGLRIGNQEFAKFVAAPEIMRTAARMGAARLVLVTSPNKCAQIGRMLAHRAAALAPIDVHLLVLNKGNVADLVRAYVASLLDDTDQDEQYEPALVLRYESPLGSRQLLDRYPSRASWVEFALAYLTEYTMAGQLERGQIPRDAAWGLPVQRIFEKYAAEPFEHLLEIGGVPKVQAVSEGSWDGVLQALKDMKMIFGGEDEPENRRKTAPLPRFAR